MPTSQHMPVSTVSATSAVAAIPPEQVAMAREWLADRDPILARAHVVAPSFDWRHRSGGYAGLIKMVVEQQVSVASAAAIWRRFESGLGVVSPQTVLASSEVELKSLGLSAPKVRYVRGIAEAVAAQDIDLEALGAMDDRSAIAALTALKGVGQWTAEIYLMFCHGRLDVFPAGDVALQEAWRVAAGHEARLTEKALIQQAVEWSPYRSVAAHLLWAYYGALKRGDGSGPLPE